MGRILRIWAIAAAVIGVLGGGAAAQNVAPLVHEAVIDAPVTEVWAAWATSEGLRSWLAPHAEIELQIDGRMRTNYAAAGVLGDAQTIENTILAFEPNRMLAIKVSTAPASFPFPNAIKWMWTVVYFTPVAANSTQIRVVSLGFGPDDESQKMRAFFETGNAATLSQLQRRFSTAR